MFGYVLGYDTRMVGLPPSILVCLTAQCHRCGKCPSSPEDEREKQRERAGTGKERLYPLHHGHAKQVTASKACPGRLMSPGTPALWR
ncbi:hypothetical protein TNCV_1458271 [Trichonephila clavipes]|nr:hypothetical protein TNCV_1458271 [Trichonephila clavipes]